MPRCRPYGAWDFLMAGCYNDAAPYGADADRSNRDGRAPRNAACGARCPQRAAGTRHRKLFRDFMNLKVQHGGSIRTGFF